MPYQKGIVQCIIEVFNKAASWASSASANSSTSRPSGANDVAHALCVPRPDSSGRPAGSQPALFLRLPQPASNVISAGSAISEEKMALARISHRLNPRLRGGAASPEAGRAEDYSGYENRGEDRKMRSEMPMDGLCLLEDDGVDTRCLSALRSSSSGGRIGQVAELG